MPVFNVFVQDESLNLGSEICRQETENMSVSYLDVTRECDGLTDGQSDRHPDSTCRASLRCVTKSYHIETGINYYYFFNSR